MKENRQKNKAINYSERGEWGRDGEREWQEKPDSLCCLPWKSVTTLAGRLRMLMGIPFSPQSALKAQDNNLLLQVWLWLSHNTSFSPLTLNKKRWSLAVPVIWVLPSQLRWRYWSKHLDIYWICFFFFFLMCEKCFVLLKSFCPTCSSICWCKHQRSRPSATLPLWTDQLVKSLQGKIQISKHQI